MLSSLHRKWGFIGEMHATTSDTSLKKHRMHIWSHILCVTCIVAKAWSHSASPPVAGWMRRKWRLARVKRETKDTFGAITRGTDENAPLQAHNGDGQRGKNGQRRRWWWRKKRRKYKWWNAYTVIMHMMFTISISPYVALEMHRSWLAHADGSTTRCRRRKYK